jgi:hypothetical protein
MYGCSPISEEVLVGVVTSIVEWSNFSACISFGARDTANVLVVNETLLSSCSSGESKAHVLGGIEALLPKKAAFRSSILLTLRELPTEFFAILSTDGGKLIISNLLLVAKLG